MTAKENMRTDITYKKKKERPRHSWTDDVQEVMVARGLSDKDCLNR